MNAVGILLSLCILWTEPEQGFVRLDTQVSLERSSLRRDASTESRDSHTYSFYMSLSLQMNNMKITPIRPYSILGANE